jgi:hypothetical protein
VDEEAGFDSLFDSDFVSVFEESDLEPSSLAAAPRLRLP